MSTLNNQTKQEVIPEEKEANPTSLGVTGDPTQLTFLPGNYIFRMKKLADYKWYKPLVATALAAIFFVVFSVAMAIGFYLLRMAINATRKIDIFAGFDFFSASPGSYLSMNYHSAFSIAFIMSCVVVLIPAVWLAMKIVGLKGISTLSSSEGKLRIKAIAAYVKWLFPLCLLISSGSIFLMLAADPNYNLGDFSFMPLALLAIVIMVPLQCAAEEYVFRGFVLQVIASWIPSKRRPAVAVCIAMVIQTIIFASLHPYNIFGVLSVAAFGFLAAYITVKTGGLEASIAMHASYNVIGIAMGSLFSGLIVQSEVSAVAFAISLIEYLLYAIVILKIAKKKNLLASQ